MILESFSIRFCLVFYNFPDESEDEDDADSDELSYLLNFFRFYMVDCLGINLPFDQ